MEMQTAALLAAKGRPSVAKLRENSTLIVPVVVPARLIDNSTQPDHIFFPHERSGTTEQDMQYKPRAVVQQCTGGVFFNCGDCSAIASLQKLTERANSPAIGESRSFR